MSLAPALLSALFACAGRAELFVTRASPRPLPEGAAFSEAADFEVHSHLLLRGVEYYAEADEFRLPAGQVRVLSDSLRGKLLEAFRTRFYLREDFPAEEIGFVVGSPRRTSPTSAEIEVVFRGELSVTLSVTRDASGFLPAYPARRRPDGRLERLFDILDPGLKAGLERAVDRRCREALR